MPRVLSYGVTSTDTLKTATLLDGQTATIATFNTGSVRFVQWQFSATRNGQTQTGRIIATCDGTVAGISTDDTFSAVDLSIDFGVTVSGSNFSITYTSTSTGFDTDFKYYEKSWI